jgi:hypothetical protein
MPQQFPESEGSLSHVRSEELAPGGPDAREHFCLGISEAWIALARPADKRVETVIPYRVNCVVRPRTLEPLLCGKIQRVGRMQRRAKQVEL